MGTIIFENDDFIILAVKMLVYEGYVKILDDGESFEFTTKGKIIARMVEEI